MKLTKQEMQYFTDLAEALQTARGSLKAQLDKLDAELEVGCNNYAGEEDREGISVFHSEIIEELGSNIDDTIFQWQTRLESFKTRFRLNSN